MGNATALLQFALMAFSAVFFIVNPFSTAPLFVTRTQGDTAEKRGQMA